MTFKKGDVLHSNSTNAKVRVMSVADAGIKVRLLEAGTSTYLRILESERRMNVTLPAAGLSDWTLEAN